MNKYIIEVEDVPFSKVRIDADGAQNINLYRAKGFNALVFDKEGLDRLTPLDTELEEAYQKGFEAGSHEATTIEYQKGFDDAKRISEEVCQLEYNKGLNDMWEAVKQLIVKWINGDDDVFGDKSIDEFIETYSASEAIAKLKAYEEQQKADEIKVGDEMEACDDPSVKIIVVYTERDSIWGFNRWGTFSSRDKDDWRKTGRNFPQVAGLFEAMKEGAE